MTDSGHLRDDLLPCDGCGATWDTTTQTLYHEADCPYLEA